MRKNLRVNFETEPVSLDPRIGTNVMSQCAIRCLFEGLMKIGKKGEITYGLAEKYSVSDDKKTYVFTLRDSCWNNGEKVSAHDFEYAWKSAAAPDSQCRVAQLFHSIKNVKKIREKQLPIEEMGVYAIDDKTLKVELEYPTPFFLKALSNPLFSPIKKESDANEREFTLISNGPFQLKEYTPNQGMRLVKNPNYYLEDQIQIDGIEVSFIKDAQTAMYMFEKNELDYIGSSISKIPFEEEEKLLKSKKLNVNPVAAIHWLGLNTERFPYNNIHFRKALAYSVDNELFGQILNQKKAAKTFVPIGFSNLKEISSWYNLKEAKAHLEQALLELNCKITDIPPLKITYCNQLAGGKKVPLLLKKQWENNLNLTVNIQEMEWNSFLDAIFKHSLDIAGLGWISYITDASYHLETFKLKSYPSNWSCWENELYVEYLDKSNETLDLEKRAYYLGEAEKIALSEMPAIPLFYEDFRYIHKPNIHGIVTTELGELEFRYISID